MSFTKVAPAGIGTEPGSEIKIGDSLLHSTGIDLGSGTGIGATITRQGNATFTGIVTATSFVGSGTALTGIDAATLKFGNSTKAEANNSGVIVSGILTVTGAMGVGGVLTYEDVTNVDSIGIITARSAVSIADSIIHTGDTNTSLRFPSADTITAETGGNERVRITSAGNIGVGEADPSPFGGEYRGVDVAYKGSGISGRTGNPTFTMRSNIYYDGSNWKYGEGNTTAGVLSVGGAQLIFETAPSGTAGATATISEKFRINTDGNTTFRGTISANGTTLINKHSVGIGTTDTAGRNAGVGTAHGTLVYNSQTKEVQVYSADNAWAAVYEEPFVATGGTKSTSGSKTIHTFTSPGTFQVTSGSRSNLEYLVVAGGGGAGGGGGGAGGYRTGTGFSVSVGSYPVTVGAGGNGGSGGPVPYGNVGNNSVFSTITSAGGGRGGGGGGGAAGNGGSGGGGGQDQPGTVGSGNTPPVSPPQGNNGGGSERGGYGGGGGGGGAGQAGSNATSATPVISRGGTGGNGVANSISGSSVTYAGGGGGGCNTNTGPAPGPGVGGSGGGGTGAYQHNTGGTAGTANTGGGGGGAEYDGPGGGNGGSGIVIVSYPTS